MDNQLVQQIVKLSEEIRPQFAGYAPPVQGAVLADLLSLWLAGHMAESAEETAALRENLLTNHIEQVRKMIPASELQIFATRRAGWGG